MEPTVIFQTVMLSLALTVAVIMFITWVVVSIREERTYTSTRRRKYRRTH